jgi:hypothetical protein
MRIPHKPLREAASGEPECSTSGIQAVMIIQISICLDMSEMVIFADPYYDLPVRRLAGVGMSSPVVPNIYSSTKKVA